MASYRLQIKPSAAKELEAVPRNDRRRIVQRIQLLADSPRPPGVRKLSGQERYRIRQGRYRVLFTVSDAERLVVIVAIAQRKETYRH